MDIRVRISNLSTVGALLLFILFNLQPAQQPHQSRILLRLIRLRHCACRHCRYMQWLLPCTIPQTDGLHDGSPLLLLLLSLLGLFLLLLLFLCRRRWCGDGLGIGAACGFLGFLALLL